MGDTVNIRLTAEDKIHLQQRMDETGKNATEVFKSAIYFTEIDADHVDEIISNKIKEYVKTIVKVLNIKGLSRIDFLYEEKTNNIYLIEINTLPGFTNISMYPKLLEYDKIKYKKIITLLIEDALTK